MNSIFENTRKASRALASLNEGRRNVILNEVADRIISSKREILEANALDLSQMEQSNPLYDRLKLTEKRLEDIASDMRHVAALPSPLGRELESRVLPNGLKLRKVSVPFGVIGVIYEARPNVTFDVFSLCFKSGNACILKGGKDADSSNRAAVAIIKSVLEENGADTDSVNLLPATHQAAGELLEAIGYVDVVIPRGGRRLIDFVRQNAKVPCIETGAGVVHAYFDADADLEMGKRIICNAKTRRVSVCNALDTLIVHSSRLSDLPALCAPLAEKNVTVYCDSASYSALAGKYPFIEPIDAPENSSVSAENNLSSVWDREYMDYKMGLKVVDSVEQAIEHIALHGSGHSECIITENREAAALFQRCVDAACVYVNAPTSFTDGAQFGLGAEIGISTQKLGPRGPMGLSEITTYKWLIEGTGQTRA